MAKYELRFYANKTLVRHIPYVVVVASGIIIILLRWGKDPVCHPWKSVIRIVVDREYRNRPFYFKSKKSGSIKKAMARGDLKPQSELPPYRGGVLLMGTHM